MGGFSFAKVPRPFAPRSRRRRPSRPFFNGWWISFVASHDIDLIDLDRTFEFNVGGIVDNAFAQLRGHAVDIVLVKIQFVGDLPIGKIEAHEIKTQNPDAHRLMMPGQDGTAQIIKAAAASLAAVALPVRLGVVTTVAGHLGARTTGAAHALGPTMLPDQLVAFGIIDERCEINQIGSSQDDTNSMLNWPNRIKHFASRPLHYPQGSRV